MSANGSHLVDIGKAKFHIKVAGVDELQKRAAWLAEQVRGPALRNAMRAAMRVFREGLESRLPPNRTGRLRRSLRVRVRFIGSDRIEGRLSVGAGGRDRAFYGYFLEAGTGMYGPRGKEYLIKPSLKKALKWPSANHPFERSRMRGIRPRRFVEVTARAELQPASVAFEQEFYRQIGQPFKP